MRFVRKAIAAGGVGLAAVAIAGCGSDGHLLSSGESQRLQAQLNSVAQAVRDGDCTGAQRALVAFQNDIGQLSGVDATLVNNLNQGASTIQALTTRKCSGWNDTPTTKPHRRKKPATQTTQATTSDTQTTDSTTTSTQPIITSTTGGAGLGDSTTTADGTTTPPVTPGTTPSDTTTTGTGTDTTGGAGYGSGAGISGDGSAAGGGGGNAGDQAQQSGYTHGDGHGWGWGHLASDGHGHGWRSGGS